MIIWKCNSCQLLCITSGFWLTELQALSYPCTEHKIIKCQRQITDFRISRNVHYKDNNIIITLHWTCSQGEVSFRTVQWVKSRKPYCILVSKFYYIKLTCKEVEHISCDLVQQQNLVQDPLVLSTFPWCLIEATCMKFHHKWLYHIYKFNRHRTGHNTLWTRTHKWKVMSDTMTFICQIKNLQTACQHNIHCK